MFWSQLTWAFGFLGIMLLIHIGKLVVASFKHDEIDTFFNATFMTSNIFMLVIGIISIHFISHFVGNGVTRKDYFKGSLLASIGLSIVIPILTFIVALVDKFILSKLFAVEYKVAALNKIEIGSNFHLIEEMIQAVLLTPYAEPERNWSLALSLFSLNIFFCYIAGWLISSSFYRFNVIAGLAFILVAATALILKNVLLRTALDLPVQSWYSWIEMLSNTAIIAIALVLVGCVAGIRLLTRKAAIKM